MTVTYRGTQYVVTSEIDVRTLCAALAALNTLRLAA